MKRLAPRHPLPRTKQVDRDQYLLELCRGQRVLDLACAAWPATSVWCADGSLLHMRLAKVCQSLAGFDWSEPGLEILRQRGIRELHCLDLLDRDQVEEGWRQLSFQPEIVLAGELFEHLDRAGLALENFRRLMAPGCRLVITVPNAFSLRSLLHVLKGYEKVARDHVSYYSYSNVRELAARNGFGLEKVSWYRYSQVRQPIDRLLDLVIGPVLWVWPQLSEGLIAECRVTDTIDA